MFKKKLLVSISTLLLIQIGVSGWSLDNGKIGESQSISVDPKISSAESIVRTDSKARVVPTPDEILLIKLINSARADPSSVGWSSYPPVGPLEPNVQLWEAARFHSEEMVNNNYFDHDSYDPAQGGYYEDCFTRMQRFGYSGWTTMGENIAMQPSVGAALNAWLNSTGHRNNIFNGDFTEHGIGIAEGGPSGNKLFTHDFGDRDGIAFDLKVSATDISFSPENPIPGQVVEISAVIHNIRKTHAFPVWVHFFNGDPNSGGELIGADSIEAIIPRNGTETSTINWNTSGESPGAHQIWVRVDPNNHFSETDEGNNEAYRNIYVGVEEFQEQLPNFSLNIFAGISSNKKIEIDYCLSSPANCLLRIYDACGRVVTTLVNERKKPGHYKINWNRESLHKSKVTPGIYFCNLRCNEIAVTKKLVIIH